MPTEKDNAAAALLNKAFSGRSRADTDTQSMVNHFVDYYIQDRAESEAEYSESDSEEEDFSSPDPGPEDNDDDDNSTSVIERVEDILTALPPVVTPAVEVSNDTDTDYFYEKEMLKIRKFDCKCQERRKENSARSPISCSKKLSEEDIYNTRLDYVALSSECRDIAIMAVYHALTNDSDMTQTTKSINHKRKRNRTTYMIKGIVICRETFCFCMG